MTTEAPSALKTTALHRLGVQDTELQMSMMQELQRRQNSARDFIVHAKFLRMAIVPGNVDGTPDDWPAMTFPIGDVADARVRYPIMSIAREQIAEKLNIGGFYNRKLLSAPRHMRQYVDTVNYWLRDEAAQEKPRKFMVRTLDNRMRAFLSDGYAAWDNVDLALTVIKVANEVGALIQRFDLTDEKFSARIIYPNSGVILQKQQDGIRTVLEGMHTGGMFGGITDAQGHASHSMATSDLVDAHSEGGPRNDLQKVFEQFALNPDCMVGGVDIRNSEVGRGGLDISPFIFQTFCTNYAIFAKGLGKIHHGKRQLEGLLTQETKQLQAAALWGEVTDVIKGTFDEQTFRAHIDQYLGLQTMELKDAAEAVEVVGKQFSFNQGETQALLNMLITQGEGATAWGLVNAVTALAQKAPDFDRRHDMEEVGGQLIQSFPRELVVVRR